MFEHARQSLDIQQNEILKLNLDDGTAGIACYTVVVYMKKNQKDCLGFFKMFY